MSEATATVTVYTLRGCPYCTRARVLLRRRGIPYREISGEGDPGFRRMLLERTGGRTVPQILIGDEAVGGSDELAALDRAGVLIPRLNGERFPFATARRGRSSRRFASAIAALLSGGARGSAPHLVELRDRDGLVLERHELRSAAEAADLAGRLNG